MVRSGSFEFFFSRDVMWRCLILDEGHKIKNEHALVSLAVKKIKAQYSLILTGTPLQNNLHELFAVLQFLHPTIFIDSEPFDDCFNLNGTSAQVDRKKLDQAHYLLRAFMLRRVKSEVEDKLPPRLETTINVPMSEMQIFWTRRLLMRDAKLLKRVEDRRAGRVGGVGGVGGAGGDTDAVADADAEASDVNGHAAGDWKRLQSLFMQLRKASNHPFLFPGAERTPSWLPATEEIIKASGKMQLLDRLLPKLQAGGHRVVLFSQFTSMLDILDDYLSMRRVAYCRLDGSTNRVQRQVNIDMFNAPSSEFFCFIMSTRAGGLGVNLQTADTVILYDSDWNPQVGVHSVYFSYY